uniref:Acid ceramidase n=1 Tax=Hadrurus spadix TaxID=141984 RepID=A0A1W7RB72_9SCOR
MAKIRSILLFLVIVWQVVYSAIPPTGQCVKDAYPPSEKRKIPSFTIDLDLPPEKRWIKLAYEKRHEINETLNVLRRFTGAFFGGKLVQAVNEFLPLMLTLPEPFKTEIASIAKATGIHQGEIMLYNVFYEVFTFCTSIVAQDDKGNLYHARNLDFGIFLGWDIKNHTWLVTEALRHNILELEFYKQKKLVYKSVGFAGYVGVITALKPKHFSLTVDERFKLNGGYIGILEWLMGDHSSHWMGFLTRSVMENATDYNSAKKILSTTKLIAPLYFILGGTKPGEACIITRDRGTNKADIMEMTNGSTGWYLLETNYDHWENPPFYDNRRTPAIKCLKKMTQKNASFAGLFNVLSTQPNLNKLTVYSALMEAKTGTLETYLQFCDDPCWPW